MNKDNDIPEGTKFEKRFPTLKGKKPKLSLTVSYT